MQCDHCGENEAVIHLTQIVNNQMGTVHLCETCAAEKGLEPHSAPDNFPLTDFLAQMGKEMSDEPSGDQCGFCGLRLEDFKKTGRLGCPECYVTFESHLRNLFRRLHGGTQHVGKVYLPADPTEADRQQRLVRLRQKLDQAVRTEDFERAARLRDEINVMEASDA